MYCFHVSWDIEERGSAGAEHKGRFEGCAVAIEV
jgi:hypothetical protein